MQFRSVALPLAFVATLASAAPISQVKRDNSNAVDARSPAISEAALEGLGPAVPWGSNMFKEWDLAARSQDEDVEKRLFGVIPVAKWLGILKEAGIDVPVERDLAQGEDQEDFEKRLFGVIPVAKWLGILKEAGIDVPVERDPAQGEDQEDFEKRLFGVIPVAKWLGILKEAGIDVPTARDLSEGQDQSLEKRLGFGAGLSLGLQVFGSLFHHKEADLSKRDSEDQSLEKRLGFEAGLSLGLQFFGSLLHHKEADLDRRDLLALDDSQPLEKRLGFGAGLSLGLKVFGALFHHKEAELTRRALSESPEKRLSWGKVAAGAAAAVVGWFTTKEGQEFLATDEGKAFVSKMASEQIDTRDVQEEEPEKRLFGVISLISGLFSHKEGQDFLASDEGKEFISKMAQLESRDVQEDTIDINDLLKDYTVQARSSDIHADLDLLGLLNSAVDINI